MLSEKKKFLSNHEEETREGRTHMKDTKWFGINEKSSKLWFSLNKTRVKNTGIMSLMDPKTNKETQNPGTMLEIARHHHAQLQREPMMTEERKRATNRILAGVKVKLNEEEKKEISKGISYNEVREALRKAPNGKAPGPDGIPNEFWKAELS